MASKSAADWKNEGNKHFQAARFPEAIHCYTEAIRHNPNDHTFYSNRSASFAGLDRWEESANDAAECIRVDKTFVKGYYRHGLALKNLTRYEEAIATLKSGLAVSPTNQDLKTLRRECEQALLKAQGRSYYERAVEYNRQGNYADALKALDNALKSDSTLTEARQLMDHIRPRHEQAEKKRRATLSPIERAKEEADALYRDAKFEVAIEKYTECINQISNRASDVRIKCLLNRSACYKQLSDFEKVINDCTEVMEFDPENVKSLLRRAQALEAMERYRLALQDVRAVLQMPYDVVGQATVKMANEMQHRLNRVVLQMREN
jgi:stress-induced-phosphoprotein 1